MTSARRRLCLDGYFNEWKDRFFLFGDRPFFQVPELEYVGQKEYDPVSEMIADMPKPEKYLFAMRGLGTTDTLSLPEAARWLVFLQSFDTAGIKTPVKGNTHINKGKIYPLKGFLGTGWLGGIGGVYAEGANLFETLMLNWVLYDDRYDLEYYRLFKKRFSAQSAVLATGLVIMADWIASDSDADICRYCCSGGCG